MKGSAAGPADTTGPVSLYPLRFEPVCQYRLWGGRRLAGLLTSPLPSDGPIGEAWLLSDRPDHQSRVADGSLAGRTLGQLREQYPEQLLGELATRFDRFPLLLKFLDAHELLSVQVHPSDRQTDYLPVGEMGKTEAWVVLEASAASRIYAGLQPGTGPENLRRAVVTGSVMGRLAGFTPQPGDAVLLPAGTVHSLGGDIVVFEVQENSDVTFRLFDWDRVDAQTGQGRALQVDAAMACIDFAQGVLGPVLPIVESTTPVKRERLFNSEHFCLWRVHGDLAFTVGIAGNPHAVVCIEGAGRLEWRDATFPMETGDVFLLPAEVGACVLQPDGEVTVLEAGLPDEIRRVTGRGQPALVTQGAS